MKLLFCKYCKDIVLLRPDCERECICGASHGKYVDRVSIEYSGPCVVLGIINNSLLEAIVRSELDPDPYTGKAITAFVIAENCEALKRIG